MKFPSSYRCFSANSDVPKYIMFPIYVSNWVLGFKNLPRMYGIIKFVENHQCYNPDRLDSCTRLDMYHVLFSSFIFQFFENFFRESFEQFRKPRIFRNFWILIWSDFQKSVLWKIIAMRHSNMGGLVTDYHE